MKKFSDYVLSKINSIDNGRETSPNEVNINSVSEYIDNQAKSSFQRLSWVNRIESFIRLKEAPPGDDQKVIFQEHLLDNLIFRFDDWKTLKQIEPYVLLDRLLKDLDFEFPQSVLGSLKRNIQGTMLITTADGFEEIKNKPLSKLSECRFEDDETGKYQIGKAFPYSDQICDAYSLGSGALVCTSGRKGLVCTSAHVLDQIINRGEVEKGLEEIRIVSGFYLNKDDEIAPPPKSFTPTRLVSIMGGRDADLDWALLEIDIDPDTDIPIRMSNQCECGMNTYCLGYPYGLPLKLSWDGILFRKAQSIWSCKLRAFGGNSGSPVFNEHGEMIGVLKGSRVNNIVVGQIDNGIKICYPWVALHGYEGTNFNPVSAFEADIHSWLTDKNSQKNESIWQRLTRFMGS